ncbi:MAG: peptidoglycan-binding protein [Eubacteriales bacterium]|nr:peptidoglycan-binding protein [Eubacteriales bacterium]
MKRLTAFLLAIFLLLPTAPIPPENAEAEANLSIQAFATLEYGDQGELVTQIQQKLSDLGYYSGKISGNFLEGTRAGVRRFQTDYALTVTGAVDEQTYEALMNAEYRTLKNGDDGDDVTRLQERLKELGYLDANATGKFRSATEGAVKSFQSHNGLTADGKADLDTLKLLYSDSALSKNVEPTPTPDPLTDVGDVNDVVMVDDGASTADSMDETPFGKTMTRGTEGADVKKVQTRLTELGFFDGPVSGYYMDQTIAAVKQFQEYNGLYPDGTMGEETWNQLFNAVNVVYSQATPMPSPVPTPIPYAVTVDVRNQVTTVYSPDENGEYTNIVRQMICSTGLNATPSDVGDWVTNGRRARWAYFSLYGSHAQYWTRINENIAFHSVIYRAVDYMALSTKSYNKLGQRASHGCIRLLVSDAKWIYENIRKGITVSIREDLPEDQELTKSLLPPPLNKAYMVPSTTPEPTPEPAYTSDCTPSEPFRKLQLKSEGEDVYWLQRRLKDLGYYEGTVTGVYWNGTKKAVKAFQKDHSLRADGIAGTNTLEKIYAEVVTTQTPMPSSTPTLAPTPSPVS